MQKLNKSQTDRTCQLTSRGAHRYHVFAVVALMEIGGDGGERAEAVTGRLKPSMAGWFVGRDYVVPMVRPATTVFVRAPKGKAHRFRTILRPVK